MNEKEIESIMSKFIEITLPDPNGFNKVREALTRIGISNKDNELFQSCHILQKRGRFFLVHFKRLFELDGRVSTLTEEDIARENTIAALLQEWNLIKILDENKIKEPRAPVGKIKIIKYNEKNNYTLKQKYPIGKKRKVKSGE